MECQGGVSARFVPCESPLPGFRRVTGISGDENRLKWVSRKAITPGSPKDCTTDAPRPAFRRMDPGCTALDQNAPAAKDAAYCDGFRRAFSIGYSDGYTNQQDNPHLAVK